MSRESEVWTGPDIGRRDVSESAQDSGSGSGRQLPEQRPRSSVAQQTLACLLVLDLAAWAQDVWLARVVALALVLWLPGYLVLRSFRLTTRQMALSPTWLVATSLVALMGLGLAVNLVGPALGIAEPLRTLPVLVAVNAFCMALSWICGHRDGRWSGGPWTDLRAAAGELDRPGALALLVPTLAAAGALRLSNGLGTSLAALAAVAAVAALAAGLVIAHRCPMQRLGWLLYGAGSGLLLSFSVRSDYVFGWDISAEYALLVQTVTDGIWPTAHPGDAYGAMLSLTVLPSVLTEVTGLSGLVLLKVVYPLLFALVPVAALAILRSWFGPRAALVGAALALAIPAFAREMPALARQEIALLVFAALLAALLDASLGRSSKIALLTLLSAGVVVSHYSTAYTLATVLAGAVLVRALLGIVRRTRAVDYRVVATLVAVLGVGMLWYVVVTDSFSQTLEKADRLLESGVETLPFDSGRDFVAAYLRGPDPEVPLTVDEYERRVAVTYVEERPWVVPALDDGDGQWQLEPAEVTQAAQPSALLRLMDLTVLAFRQGLVALALVGTVLLVVRPTSPSGLADVGVYAVPTLVLLGGIRVSPSVAGIYGTERLYLQLLPVIAAAALWALCRLVALGSRAIGRMSGPASARGPTVLRAGGVAVVSVALLVQVAVAAGLVPAALGDRSSGNLSDRGEHVARFYVTDAEVAAAEWLASVQPEGDLTYTDNYGQLRVYGYGRVRGPLLADITPDTVDVNAWVYATRTNTVEQEARGFLDNQVVVYRFPRDFLLDRLGLVYSNGSSEVFHR